MRDSLIERVNRSIQIDRSTMVRLLVIAVVLLTSAYVVPRTSGIRLWLLLAIVPAIGIVVFLLKRPHWGIMALLPTALIVPFAIGTGTQTQIVMVVPLIGVLFGLWVLNMVVQRQVHIAHVRPLLPLFCLVVAVTLAFINGQLPWFSVRGAPLAAQLGGLSIFLLSAAVLLLVAHQLDDVRWLRWLVWSFLGLGSLYALGQLTPLGAITGRIFPVGATGSLFWVWLTALAAAQALFNSNVQSRWRLALGALAAGALGIGLLNFEWKSGWLPSLVALAVVLWLSVPRLRLWLLLIAGLAAAPYVLNAINALLVEESYSWNTRLVAWRIVLEVAQVSPVLGLGPANYYFYTPLIPILGYRIKFNSHNQYVDLIAQTGVVGLVCFLWFVGAMWRLAWRLFHRLPNGFERAYAAGVLGGTAGVLVAGMLGDWVLPFVYNVGLAGFRSSILAWLFWGGLVALSLQSARSANHEVQSTDALRQNLVGANTHGETFAPLIRPTTNPAELRG